jgi:hypothetical protein
MKIKQKMNNPIIMKIEMYMMMMMKMMKMKLSIYYSLLDYTKLP